MSRVLTCALLIGVCMVSGCEKRPVERAVFSGTPAPRVEKEVPQAPSFTEALDAYELGEQSLLSDPDLRAYLRALQHQLGERTIASYRSAWDARADMVMDLTRRLSRHGLDIDSSQSQALERLQTLRASSLAYGAWRGEALQDAGQVRRLVEADHLVAFLWLRAAQGLGALAGHPPESEVGMSMRLLHALAFWEVGSGLEHTLPPPMKAYWSLVEALERYEKMEEAAFGKLPKRIRRARPGKATPDILLLRQRLALEDPEGAGAGELWDEALSEALRRARAAYQLKPKRKARYLLDKRLVAALEVPLKERIATIKLNLRRWHHSKLRHFTYVIFVNLPEYHGEVWADAERLHRFKVVIGNTRKKGRLMVNATPRLWSAVRTIVYNPYWTVPNRIYEEELLVKAEAFVAEQVASSPALAAESELIDSYWNSKGYEVFGKGRKSGRIWVRRKPGPGNALGKVKFLFDNLWAVFLHDTPQKRKFKATRRAFSHGCIRVHQPLDLAELLLRRDGQWPAVEAAKVFSHYKEKVFSMKDPVWLVVDYLSTRVDEKGRTHFYHDVYRRDHNLASR